MTIPKQRYSYRPAAAIVSLCLIMSIVATVIGSTLAQAFSLPDTLRGGGLFSQKNNRSDEKLNKQGSNNLVAPVPAQQVPQASAPAPASSVPNVPSGTSAQPTIQAAATVPSTPPDTSAVSRQIASIQSEKPSVSQQYTSAKISGYERDRLYKFSSIGAGIGAALYMLSYAPLLFTKTKRALAPARRTVIPQ